MPTGDRNIFELARSKLPQDQHAAYDALLAEYFDFGNIFSKADADLPSLHERFGKYLLPAMGYDAALVDAAPKSGGWTVFALYFSLGRSFDFRPAVASISAPTLIVQGEDDDLSLAGSLSYKEVIPDSEFITISRGTDTQAGHFAFDDCPEEFANVVQDFIDRP